MEDQERSLQIAKEIWRVLRTAPNIIMSWGLNPATVRAVENGLRFHVQGFKHTGNVEIKLNEGADLYEIFLYDESGKQTDYRKKNCSAHQPVWKVRNYRRQSQKSKLGTNHSNSGFCC